MASPGRRWSIPFTLAFFVLTSLLACAPRDLGPSEEGVDRDEVAAAVALVGAVEPQVATANEHAAREVLLGTRQREHLAQLPAVRPRAASREPLSPVTAIV